MYKRCHNYQLIHNPPKNSMLKLRCDNAKYINPPNRKIMYSHNPNNKGLSYGVIPPSQSKNQRPLYYEGYCQYNCQQKHAWKYGYLAHRLSGYGPGNTWKNGVGEVIIYGEPVPTGKEDFGLGYGAGNEWAYNNPRNYNHSMGFKAYVSSNPRKYVSYSQNTCDRC